MLQRRNPSWNGLELVFIRFEPHDTYSAQPIVDTGEGAKDQLEISLLSFTLKGRQTGQSYECARKIQD